MATFLNDFFAFLVAVVMQWQACAGGLLAIALDFYLKSTGKELTKRRYVHVFGGVSHSSRAAPEAATPPIVQLSAVFGRPDAWTPDERRAILVPEG